MKAFKQTFLVVSLITASIPAMAEDSGKGLLTGNEMGIAASAGAVAIATPKIAKTWKEALPREYENLDYAKYKLSLFESDIYVPGKVPLAKKVMQQDKLFEKIHALEARASGAVSEKNFKGEILDIDANVAKTRLVEARKEAILLQKEIHALREFSSFLDMQDTLKATKVEMLLALRKKLKNEVADSQLELAQAKTAFMKTKFPTNGIDKSGFAIKSKGGELQSRIKRLRALNVAGIALGVGLVGKELVQTLQPQNGAVIESSAFKSKARAPSSSEAPQEKASIDFVQPLDFALSAE